MRQRIVLATEVSHGVQTGFGDDAGCPIHLPADTHKHTCSGSSHLERLLKLNLKMSRRRHKVDDIFSCSTTQNKLNFEEQYFSGITNYSIYYIPDFHAYFTLAGMLSHTATRGRPSESRETLDPGVARELFQ